jgi:hypothetical protein
MRQLVLAALLCSLAPAQTGPGIDRGWVIAGELVAAPVVGYGCAIAGGAGAVLLTEPDVRAADVFFGGRIVTTMLVSYGIALPIGCSVGAWGAGSLLGDRRDYWPSLLGSGCGVIFGACLLTAAANIEHFDVTGATILTLAAPPLGAVIGYNLGQPLKAGQAGVQSRFDMPRVTMAFTDDELGRPVPEARCDIVTLRL